MLRSMLLSLALVTAFAAEDADPFAGASFTASATGMLITRFAPEAQAEQLGLKVGDIITMYAGTPVKSQDELIGLVQRNTANAPVVVQRGDRTLTVSAKPGRLGVYLEAVEAGMTRSLPADTHVAFDTARLRSAPIDTWYAFIIDGKKVGAEHARLQREGDRLVVSSEVMFDGGKKWGLNHMVETGVLDVSTAVPRVITLVHEGPLWGFRAAGRWKDASTWELTIDGKDDDGKPSHEVMTSTPAGPLINDYSFSHLASLMPTEPGACHHTRTLAMNSAEATGLSALLVIGPEDIIVGDAPVSAIRMEQRSLRGRGWIAWVKDGEVIKHDYAGGDGTTIALKTSREQALAGLDPKLVPLTAGGSARP